MVIVVECNRLRYLTVSDRSADRKKSHTSRPLVSRDVLSPGEILIFNKDFVCAVKSLRCITNPAAHCEDVLVDRCAGVEYTEVVARSGTIDMLSAGFQRWFRECDEVSAELIEELRSMRFAATTVIEQQ